MPARSPHKQRWRAAAERCNIEAFWPVICDAGATRQLNPAQGWTEWTS